MESNFTFMYAIFSILVILAVSIVIINVMKKSHPAHKITHQKHRKSAH